MKKDLLILKILLIVIVVSAIIFGIIHKTGRGKNVENGAESDPALTILPIASPAADVNTPAETSIKPEEQISTNTKTMLDSAQKYSLRGKVIDSSGKIMSNIQVGPVYCDVSGEEKIEDKPLFASTDENGIFRLNSLRNASYKIQVAHDGYVAKVVYANPPFSQITIILEPGGTSASGTVAGSKDGNACAGIMLRLVGNDIELNAISDAKGGFKFSGLSAGKYYIEPYNTKRILGKPTVFSSDGKINIEDIVVKINQGIKISGKVVFARTSQPAEGVALEIKMPSLSYNTISGKDGEFEFHNVIVENKISIDLISTDYKKQPDSVTSENTNTIDEFMPENDINSLKITVEKIYNIKGKVDGISAEEAKKIRVKLQDISGTKHDFSLLSIKDDMTFSKTRIGGGNLAIGLVDGNVKPIGAIIEFTLSPNEDPPFIILSRCEPYEIRGIVLDHLNKPLPECKITASGVSSISDAKSEQDGAFSLKTFEKRCLLTFSSAEYSSKITQEIFLPTEQELSIRFSLGNILTGFVVDSKENPVSSAKLTYKWNSLKDNSSKSNMIIADKDGKFKMTDVDAQTLTHLDCEGNIITDDGKKTQGRSQFYNIALPAENFKITLNFARDVELKFINFDETPFSGKITLSVDIYKPEQGIFVTDRVKELKVEQGILKLSAMPSGRYKFEARTIDGRTGLSDEIDVGDNIKLKDIVIKLSESEAVFGSINDKDNGNPVSDANISINGILNDGKEFSIIQHSLDSGYFEIKNLSDGKYKITFSKTGYDSQTQAITFTANKADIRLPLDIRLEKSAGYLKGVTLNPSGEPEGGVKISLATELTNSQGYLLSAESADDGAFIIEGVAPGKYMLTALKNDLTYSTQINIDDEKAAQEITIKLAHKIHIRGIAIIEDEKHKNEPLIFTMLSDKATISSSPEIVRLDESNCFEIFLPPGTYSVRLGESNMSKQLMIPDDKEEIELEIKFSGASAE